MTATVVVIEDIAAVQFLVREALRGIDAKIVSAPDGESGWDRVHELIPDLAVLDLALPGIDGWEVLRRIRGNPATEHIPVVVVTAHGQPGTADLSASLGADAFIEKPFRPSALRGAVSGLLSNGRGVSSGPPTCNTATGGGDRAARQAGGIA